MSSVSNVHVPLAAAAPAPAELSTPAGVRESSAPAKKVNVSDLPAGYSVHQVGPDRSDPKVKKPLRDYELRLNGEKVAALRDDVHSQPQNVRGNVAYGGFKHSHVTSWRLTDPAARRNVAALSDHGYGFRQQQGFLQSAIGLSPRGFANAARNAAEAHRVASMPVESILRYQRLRYPGYDQVAGHMRSGLSHESALAQARAELAAAPGSEVEHVTSSAERSVPTGSEVSGDPKA